MENTEALRTFYNQNPFPKVSIFAAVSAADVHLLNYEAGLFASFGAIPAGSPERPRILVVGGGTFEPYVVAKANPNAEVVALDLSERALKSLRRRLFLHGLGRRVTTVQGDIRKFNPAWGRFHYIVATGVLHHMPDPEAALAVMDRLLLPNGIMRLMLYSKHGREAIYRLRRLGELCGVKTPNEFRKMVKLLPANHPLKITFDLYTDAKSDEGLNDGFFHVCDQARDAFGWKGLLASSGLQATKFLHSKSGQAEHLDTLLSPYSDNVKDPWERIGILDRLNELESNFIFFAARGRDLNAYKASPQERYILNPALQGSEGQRVYSRVLEREIEVPGTPCADKDLLGALFVLRRELSR